MYRRVCISSTNLVACLNKLRLGKGRVADPTDEHGKPTQAEAYLDLTDTSWAEPEVNYASDYIPFAGKLIPADSMVTYNQPYEEAA